MKKHLRRAQVLLIDDNPGDLLLIQTALKKATWVEHMHLCDGPPSALAFFSKRTRSFIPDIIISDFNMPFGGGNAILKFVRNNRKFRNIPIVMLSSNVETVTITGCYGRGANIYLRKPGNIESLQRMMEELGNFWKRTQSQKISKRKRAQRWWQNTKYRLLNLSPRRGDLT